MQGIAEPDVLVVRQDIGGAGHEDEYDTLIDEELSRYNAVDPTSKKQCDDEDASELVEAS